uniref:Coenzyme A biosynthesis bifunctional protein CoaBC n=1 Tax=Candidatus Aschnera chinzeii TaxID=1485666 RepID=A0AAT9G526_9ENTR|nr:MAG: bifunctional phosphopantothenoylcysteine decarboxylase/phosphopantothenate--cysteine ligase CoaBC [Candidatus Aschnera chinzeii]
MNIQFYNPVNLTGKNIIIGISGSIAAYKIPELISNLRKSGANVRVIMTIAAKSFISPLTLEIISGNAVLIDLFTNKTSLAINHIKYAKWAHIIILVPASANLIARLAIGMTNDLLTTICLASTATIAVVPAMNKQMFAAYVTKQNIKTLKQRGILIWGPNNGLQACGDNGYGRMIEPYDILKLIKKFFNKKQDMLNINITITAGPTHEKIDIIRYMSNYSSGKMGFAVAKAAAERGAKVTLITGPVNLSTPLNIKRINIISALDMYREVHNIIHHQNIFISCAAVSDYRPKIFKNKKIKKNDNIIFMPLIKNPDIVSSVGKLIKDRPYVVGFAAETKDIKKYARIKLISKNLDLICANNIALNDRGFNAKKNKLYLIWKDKEISLPYDYKTKLGHYLLDNIIKDYEKKYKN